MINAVSIAKWVMTLMESDPKFDPMNIGELREVFSHDAFLNGTQAEKIRIMLGSCASKERDEHEFPFDNYFGFSLRPYLQDKKVLDLGCFTGGRTAAWLKNYGLQHASGIDIEQVFIDSATMYTQINALNCDFKVGFGESIPYPYCAFDAVLTFDVLEHVVDVSKTLSECRRVLVPGGKIYIVFPTYLQPNEHHLGMVSKVPGLQLVFSGKTLVRAYYEIIEERGRGAYWYRRSSPELELHEKGHTINGMSFQRFMSIVKSQGWKVEFISRAPVGSIGRSVVKHPWRRLLMKSALPLTYIPLLQEIVLHRVTMILVK